MASKYRPLFTKAIGRKLAAECMQATSLADCADIIERYASELETECIKRNDRTAKTGALAGIEWVNSLRKLATALRAGRAAYKVFNKGNVKLPFYSYSELPEFTCPGAGACLNFCYSFTAWRYPDAFCRQLQNTLLMRFKRSVIVAAFMAIPVKKGTDSVTLRLYVDGDFRDMTVLAFWMGLLNKRPEVSAYGYSKSWELFDNWEKQGLSWPANYTLNMSSGSKYADNADLKGRMKELAVTRGEFVAVEPKVTVTKGFARFNDSDYHNAVRVAGREYAGNPRVFSCPGQCGNCMPNGKHACGQRDFLVTIAIGFHS